MLRMLTGFSFLFFIIAPIQAQDANHPNAADDPIIIQPGEIEWIDGPSSFEEGSQMAVLEGDPAEPYFYTLKLKLPDGFVISPHWHPRVERVTVISGTFRLGHGEVFNRDSTERLEAGTYVSLPAEMLHYAVTEGETVVQISSIGPLEINYINPKDDPRKR